MLTGQDPFANTPTIRSTPSFTGQKNGFLRLYFKLYFAQSMLECLVYGCYIVTFGLSMYVLNQRRRRDDGRIRWDVWALVSLFLIATVVTITDLIANASMLYYTFGLGGLQLDLTSVQIDKFNVVIQIIAELGFVSANFLADCVLMFRCYAVWNRRIKIIIFPMILSLIVNSIGLTAVALLISVFSTHNPTSDAAGVRRNLDTANKLIKVFFEVNAIPNVLLTTLIAGRIWRTMRQLEKIAPDIEVVVNIKKRYQKTLILILESGVIYPATLITFVIVMNTLSLSPSFYPLVSIMAGLAPSLIIVRIQLGISVNFGLHEGRNQIQLTDISTTQSDGVRRRTRTQTVILDEEHNTDSIH